MFFDILCFIQCRLEMVDICGTRLMVKAIGIDQTTDDAMFVDWSELEVMMDCYVED